MAGELNLEELGVASAPSAVESHVPVVSRSRFEDVLQRRVLLAGLTWVSHLRSIGVHTALIHSALMSCYVTILHFAMFLFG